MKYPKKTRFKSVPIAALCLYNIQRENLVLKNSFFSRTLWGWGRWGSRPLGSNCRPVRLPGAVLDDC